MRMKIGGLQKVSTIDYPGEISCVIFLWGCNFRCGFCYNSDLVVREIGEGFSEEYVLDFLSKRVGKLDAVVISGGEPLVNLNLNFVKKIKNMGFKIKLDTNGSFPDRLKEMIDLGLVDYVAMDVKGCREDYGKIVNVDVCLDDIERSIRIVNDFGGEFRTTVVPGLHDRENMRKMGKWVSDVCEDKVGRIFLQGFRVSDSMIDSSFLEKRDATERDLLEIKEGLGEFFEEIGIRA